MGPIRQICVLLCIFLALGFATAQHDDEQNQRRGEFTYRKTIERCLAKSMNPGRCYFSWFMAESVVREGIAGDILEAGVASGAQSYVMFSVLRHYQTSRKLYMADSWQGLPDAKHSEDVREKFQAGNYHVPFDELQKLFGSAGINATTDPRIVVVKGYFNETLHRLNLDRLAVLRIDGDMYESTYQALEALYPSVSGEGFVYIDDYDTFDACRRAVDDYRKKHGITDLIYPVAEMSRGQDTGHDGAVWWRKGWVGKRTREPTS